MDLRERRELLERGSQGLAIEGPLLGLVVHEVSRALDVDERALKRLRVRTVREDPAEASLQQRVARHELQEARESPPRVLPGTAAPGDLELQAQGALVARERARTRPRSGRPPSRRGCVGRRRRTRREPPRRSRWPRAPAIASASAVRSPGLLGVPRLEKQLAQLAVERRAGRRRELFPEGGRPHSLVLGPRAARDSLQLSALGVKVEALTTGADHVLVLADGRVFAGERNVVRSAAIPRHCAARSPHPPPTGGEPGHEPSAPPATVLEREDVHGQLFAMLPGAAWPGLTLEPVRERERTAELIEREVELMTLGEPKPAAAGRFGLLASARHVGDALAGLLAFEALLLMDRADEHVELTSCAERSGPDVVTLQHLDDRVVAILQRSAVPALRLRDSLELVADLELARDREAHEGRADQADHDQPLQSALGVRALVVVEAEISDHRVIERAYQRRRRCIERTLPRS